MFRKKRLLAETNLSTDPTVIKFFGFSTLLIYDQVLGRGPVVGDFQKRGIAIP